MGSRIMGKSSCSTVIQFKSRNITCTLLALLLTVSLANLPSSAYADESSSAVGTEVIVPQEAGAATDSTSQGEVNQNDNTANSEENASASTELEPPGNSGEEGSLVDEPTDIVNTVSTEESDESVFDANVLEEPIDVTEEAPEEPGIVPLDDNVTMYTANYTYLQKVDESNLPGQLLPGTHYEYDSIIIRYSGVDIPLEIDNGIDEITIDDDNFIDRIGSAYSLCISDYISLASASTSVLTMKASTIDALIETSTSDLASFDIILKFQADAPTPETQYVRITINKATLSLSSNLVSFNYGEWILDEVNNTAFINQYATLPSVLSESSSSMFIGTSIANNSVLIRNPADNSSAYPLPGESFSLVWGATYAVVRPEHIDNIVIAPGQLNCTINPTDTSPLTELILNNDAETSDSVHVSNPNQTIWLKTAQAVLSSIGFGVSWNIYDSFSWVTGQPTTPTPLTPGVAFDPTDLIGKTVVTDDGAIYIDSIKVDIDIPSILSFSITEPVGVNSRTHVNGKLVIYDEAVFITLTFTDIDISPSSASSGLKDYTLIYDNNDYEDGDTNNDDQFFDFVLDPDLVLPDTYHAALPGNDFPMGFAFDLKRFTLTVADTAGNKVETLLDSESTENTLDTGLDTILVDDIDPQVEVLFDGSTINDGGYYAYPQEATVIISSLHMQTLIVVYPDRAVATDQAGRALLTAEEFVQGTDGRWYGNYSFATDGDYTIYVLYSDLLEREAISGPHGFTVDRIEPFILVTFDNENSHSFGYYNAPRTATIEVMDENTNPSLFSITVTAVDIAGNDMPAPTPYGWYSSDNTWKGYVYFGNEFTYTLTVGARDFAGNTAAPFEVTEFIIDMTVPVLTIENVMATYAYAGNVAPRVTFSDLNLEVYSSSVDITRANNGNAYYGYNTTNPDDNTKVVTFTDFPHEPEYDDVYIFSAQAVDKAGNVAQASFAFSVNRFGSTYWFNPETVNINGSYINQPQDITIYEINASGLDESRTSVNLSFNGSAKLLERGTDYTLTSEVSRQTLWHQYTYVLPASTLVEDGRYGVTVRSTDNAGSLSENTMSNKNADRTSSAELAFIYDKTAPTASIDGIETGETYFGDTRVFTAYGRDNIAWAQAILYVNGIEVARQVNDSSEPGATFEYTLKASDQSLSIKFEVADRAGNITAVTVADVRVSSRFEDLPEEVTPELLWQLVLIRTMVVAFFVVVVAALLLSVYYNQRKKRRATEEDKIVFSENGRSDSRETRKKK